MALAYMPDEWKQVFDAPEGSAPEGSVTEGSCGSGPAAVSKAATPAQIVDAPKATAPAATLSHLQLRLETLRNLEKQMELDSDVIVDVRAEKLRLKKAIKAMI
jgi:hypothetical protein